MSLFSTADAGLTDNEVLDQFTIPFGSWTEESVNWVTLNLEWLLDAIAWPFRFLISNLVEGFLVELPWLWLVAIAFLVAWLVRNLTVAFSAAAGLAVCGLLGQSYWEETARTIGLILVAVLLCVLIGIPLGILAGRIDAVWSVFRPVLDAMQVIHSFVYLLPFIYFWGIGAVGATMATMVFALPPLIRLTNLGIRQVPEDVVEAARSYGAPERRVLIDVQLPLARPAIMTGINQTLLLAFSMLGVAAIMGAGGLGRLLFRALGQQDVSLAASAGLAFFILAVVLDRIAQTDSSQANLFSRMTSAWRARKAPELLLTDPEFIPDAAPLAAEPVEEHTGSEGDITAISARERTNMLVTAGGAVIMLISVLLVWANDAALISGWSRRVDEARPGESFSGLAAEGGSWFAFGVVAMAVFVLVSVVRVNFSLGGGRWLAPDGALFAAIGGLLGAFGYFVTRPSVFTVDYSHGIGVYVCLIGGLIASVGALMWVLAAPYSPRRPLKPHVKPAPIVLGLGAVLFAVISMFSMWSLDQRADSVMTPEIQAEIDEVKRAAAAGEMEPGVAATNIQVITAQVQQAEEVEFDGKSSKGAGLGLWTLALSVLGAVGAAAAAGALGLGDRRRWIGGTIAIGLGTGVIVIATGWVGSLARATDPNFVSGVGAMFAGLTGVLLMAAGGSIVGGFERSKVYGEADLTDTPSLGDGLDGSPMGKPTSPSLAR